MQHGNRTFSDQQGELRQQRETCELSFCTPSKIQLDLSACELHYSQPATPELIKRGNDEEVRGGIETQEQGECVENVGANAGSVEQQQQQHGQQQATQQEQQQQSDEEWSEGCEEREEEQQEEDCTAAVPRVCTARARLLRHCVTAQQDAQQTGMQQSGEHLCQLPSAVAAASAGGEGDTTPRLARVFRCVLCVRVCMYLCVQQWDSIQIRVVRNALHSTIDAIPETRFCQLVSLSMPNHLHPS